MAVPLSCVLQEFEPPRISITTDAGAALAAGQVAAPRGGE